MPHVVAPSGPTAEWPRPSLGLFLCFFSPGTLGGLTDDLDCEVDLVLAHGVLHRDSVDALILLLCPLDREDAAILGGFHPDPTFSLTQQLRGWEVGSEPKLEPQGPCNGVRALRWGWGEPSTGAHSHDRDGGEEEQA